MGGDHQPQGEGFAPHKDVVDQGGAGRHGIHRPSQQPAHQRWRDAAGEMVQRDQAPQPPPNIRRPAGEGADLPSIDLIALFAVTHAIDQQTKPIRTVVGNDGRDLDPHPVADLTHQAAGEMLRAADRGVVAKAD